MLKIEEFVTPSPAQWKIVIKGMRNPKNSWGRMDSDFHARRDIYYCDSEVYTFVDEDGSLYLMDGVNLGPNDKKLAMSLSDGGPVHAKYRRMLPVHVTIDAPLYWWKEFDTYRVGVCPNPTDIEMNSCSTMHKIHSKEFTLEDFSTEHLFDGSEPYFIKGRDPIGKLKETIEELNFWRLCYMDESKALGNSILLDSNGNPMPKKNYWLQMIQLLPSSYNQKRTLSMNYEVLANIYEWRRNHKLDEWHVVCDWIESLPYSELITGDLSRE